jgi:hypothetical protein
MLVDIQTFQPRVVAWSDAAPPHTADYSRTQPASVNMLLATRSTASLGQRGRDQPMAGIRADPLADVWVFLTFRPCMPKALRMARLTRDFWRNDSLTAAIYAGIQRHVALLWRAIMAHSRPVGLVTAGSLPQIPPSVEAGAS